MKQYIYVMVLVLIFSACTTTNDKTQIISVLEDQTETDFIAQPTAETIIPLYGFKTDIWQSARFRYGRITSLMHNARAEVNIKGQQALFGNELERKQLVVNFTSNIQQLLSKPKDSTIYQHSSIWLPLVEELKELQKLPNTKSTIYIFSDLRENTRWFSTYRATDIKQLHTDFDTVVKLFLKKANGITASDDITIVVVYQPRNEIEDENFNRIKKLYLKLFSDLGITITFKTNL